MLIISRGNRKYIGKNPFIAVNSRLDFFKLWNEMQIRIQNNTSFNNYLYVLGTLNNILFIEDT